MAGGVASGLLPRAWRAGVIEARGGITGRPFDRWIPRIAAGALEPPGEQDRRQEGQEPEGLEAVGIDQLDPRPAAERAVQEERRHDVEPEGDADPRGKLAPGERAAHDQVRRRERRYRVGLPGDR